MASWKIIQGDNIVTLKGLTAKSVRTCVSSPPYFGGQREYPIEPTIWADGWEGVLGDEPSPQKFADHLVQLFREVRRVLTDDGTLWLNLGDCYATGNQWPGIKHKDLVGSPWLVAFALRADGWFLRMDNIWFKPSPTAESIQDRPTKSHEYVFLFAKEEQYYYDLEAIREDPKPENAGRMSAPKCGDSRRSGPKEQNYKEYDEVKGANRRSVWPIQPRPSEVPHIAPFPIELPERCILAGSAVGDTVLDVFNGSGTTGLAALKHGRNYIGIEKSPLYVDVSKARLSGAAKSEISGGPLVFCPMCESKGVTKLFERAAVEKAAGEGKKITCPKCMGRFTAEDLVVKA